MNIYAIKLKGNSNISSKNTLEIYLITGALLFATALFTSVCF